MEPSTNLELLELLLRAGQPGVDAQRIAAWLGRACRARVSVVRPGGPRPRVLAEHGQIVTEMSETGPERGPGIELVAGRDRVRVMPVPGPPPRMLLVAARPQPWSPQEILLLEQAAAGAGVLERRAVLDAREAGIAEREALLTEATAGNRVAAFQNLMLGNVRRAAYELAALLPELAAAGAGQVAVVEYDPEEEDRLSLAVDVDRALGWRALTVMRPEDDQVIVVAPVEGVPLETALAPVVAARPGRAAGVSQTSPLQHTAAAYSAAVGALGAARRHGTVVVDDGRRPLAERLGMDARIWSARILQPMDAMPRSERAALLEIARTVLHSGTTRSEGLLGSRHTLARKMAVLTERTGLDPADVWHRAALLLALDLEVLPPPIMMDRHVTIEDVLDHPAARSWSDDVVESMSPSLRETVTAWLFRQDQADAVAAELGIAKSSLYARLARAAEVTRLEITRPGPAAEMALALYVAGDVAMGSLPALSHRRPRPAPGGDHAMPDTFDPAEVDVTVAHPARIYNYWIGGKTHFKVDRDAARKLHKTATNWAAAALGNRAFMQRSARALVTAEGVRQILDIGSGIPAPPTLHEVAQANAPESRVVYVDNDPIVLACSRALLHSTPQGRVSYAHADVVTTPAHDLVALPQVRNTLDMGRPVALFLMAILHFMDDHEAARIVRELRAQLAPGSYMVITQLTADFAPELVERAVAQYNTTVRTLHARTREQIADFFDGMEILEPGVTSVPSWRPDPNEGQFPDDQVNEWAAVGRIPPRTS